MIEFKKIKCTPDIDRFNEIHEIFIDGEYAGCIETNYRSDINSLYIENIKKNKDYKGKGLLKQVIEELHKKYNIGCLPLPKYRSYYEYLGFTEYFSIKIDEQAQEDIYYILRMEDKFLPFA